MKHDDIVRKLRALAKKADRRAIAGAFLASIGQKPNVWRAPLGALAAGERVPAHRYQAFSASSKACRECGVEPTERLYADDVSERGELLPGDRQREEREALVRCVRRHRTREHEAPGGRGRQGIDGRGQASRASSADHSRLTRRRYVTRR